MAEKGEKPTLRLSPVMTFDNGLMVATIVDPFVLPRTQSEGEPPLLEEYPAGTVVITSGKAMRIVVDPVTVEAAVLIAANTLDAGLPDQGPLAQLCAGMLALAEINKKLMQQIAREKIERKTSIILPGRMR